MIAALLLLVGHGPSKSWADWVIEGRTADVRINFQAHDLTRSQQIGDEKSLMAAVLAGTRFSATPGAPEPEVPCEATPGEVRSAGDPVEEVQVTLRFTCPAPIGVFTASQQYLPGLSPPHVTVASFATAEGAYDHVFGPETPEVTRRAAVVARGGGGLVAWLLAAIALAGASVWAVRRRRRA